MPLKPVAKFLVLLLVAISAPVFAAEKLLFDMPFGWKQVALDAMEKKEVRHFIPNDSSPEYSEHNLYKTTFSDNHGSTPEAVIKQEVEQLSAKCKSLVVEDLVVESRDNTPTKSAFITCTQENGFHITQAVIAVQGQQKLFMLSYVWRETQDQLKALSDMRKREHEIAKSFSWARVCLEGIAADSCNVKRQEYISNRAKRASKPGVVLASPIVEKW